MSYTQHRAKAHELATSPRWVGRGGDFWPALAAMGLSSAFAAFFLRLWEAHPSLPVDDRRRDVSVNMMWVKGMIEHGWTLSNSNLGAPFAQRNYDFPVVDTLHFAVMKAIGFLTSDAGLVLNIYFLLGFPLVALVTFLVLRHFGVSRATGIVCATLFCLLPDHFLRGEAHLTLSSYYVIPVAGYLMLAVMGGNPLFAKRTDTHGGALRQWLTRRSLTTVAFCGLIGAADLYYAAFTVMLITAAALLRSLSSRRRQPLAVGAVLVATIGAIVALQLTPAVLYGIVHGRNQAVASRDPAQSEYYSLNLTHLVLPIANHRLGPFAELERDYRLGTGPAPFQRTVAPGEGPLDHLGLIDAIALLGLLGLTITMAVDERFKRRLPARLRDAGTLTTIALVISTTGGVSMLFALLVTPQLRAWGRMSVVIAFFCIFAVALCIDLLRRKLSGSGRGRAISYVLLGGLLVVGALDQTSDAMIPHYKRQAAEARSTSALVILVERSLPTGSRIFELPYERYPEPGSKGHRAAPNDSVLPYLYSKHLRWSYGAMAGRPADFAATLKDEPPELIAPKAVGAGFAGIWVDRFAFDNGAAAALEARLTRTIGSGPVRSRDGRYAFYDLRAYKSTLKVMESGHSSRKPAVSPNVGAAAPAIPRSVQRAKLDWHAWHLRRHQVTRVAHREP